MTDVVTTTLADCEQVIERGLATFIEVGHALLTIRDERLYRDAYGTFEDYCRERWHFERAHAYRLISAAEVATAVSPMGDISSERQARELTGLPVETQREVFAKATKATNGKPTAAAIRDAREEIAPRARVVHTSSTTDKTTETVDVDTSTGEVISSSAWERENQPHPLAAAHAEVERQPAVVAGKGIERLHLAVKTFETAGSATEIVADLVNDELVDRSADWLDVLDKSAVVIADLIAALRRSRLRSAK